MMTSCRGDSSADIATKDNLENLLNSPDYSCISSVSIKDLKRKYMPKKIIFLTLLSLYVDPSMLFGNKSYFDVL
jgi:hypothetical protein